MREITITVDPPTWAYFVICPKCGVVLARLRDDGRAIKPSEAVVILTRSTLTCTACGFHYHWRPRTE